MSTYRLPSEQQLKREFQKLHKPVKIQLFLSPDDNPDQFSAYEFIRAIANYDPRIELNLITRKAKPNLFEQYKIEETPTITIEGTGIQYTGVPSGPETTMFIQTIVMKSTEDSGIGEVISRVIASLTKDVQLRTIITSQCTICPLAVKIGNMFAIESAIHGNGHLKHEIIEALEHSDYVSDYDLSAVPIILINNQIAFNGIPDVNEFLLKIAEVGK